MTRDEALFELGENFNDKELGFVNNIQLICKIFNDHETAIEILMKANEEEISRHFNECEKYEAQLKAKESDLERQDMIIKCLNIDLDNKEKLLKDKEEDLKLAMDELTIERGIKEYLANE